VQDKNKLLERLEHCRKIIEGLENNEAFKLLIGDFENTAKRLDENWQWINEDKVLKEAQITKMATLSIINSLANYRHDIEQVKQQLDKLENPDKLISADFDNEGVKDA